MPLVDASLAFAEELEQRDAALAERLALLGDLGLRVDDLRAQVERLGRFLDRLPAELAQLDVTRAQAEGDLAVARTALERARHSSERARGEDAVAAARKYEARAATDARTREERRTRLAARREGLEQEADAADAGSRSLEAQAHELAAELERAPRVTRPDPPVGGLDGLREWGSRAHAAVFVARSGLETEREQVVREANELAGSVLGEPVYATSVAAVRRRLEERLP